MGKIMYVMGKNGLVFTLIAITTMVVFIILFTPQFDIFLQKDTQAVRTRIGSIDNYVDDIENRYIENALGSATYRTILSMIYYVNATGLYINNLDSSFNEIILNSTINMVSIDSVTGKKLMEGYTLTNWSGKIIKVSKDTLNVNTTINLSNVAVFQTDAWHIKSTLNYSFKVESGVAKWEKHNLTATAEISIEGLYDPYYLANTNGLYANTIKKSSLLFNQWNTEKVREQLRDGIYFHWQDSEAPSFLMRLTNTISNSPCCGIESFVNPNKVSPSDRIESYVDYVFWRHTFSDCSRLYNINLLSPQFPNFKLDLDRVVRYNIGENDAAKNC